MGFSLELFFDELFEIINSDDMGSLVKVAALCAKIREGHRYAKQCGQVNNEH